MTTKNLTCIVCPVGCSLEVTIDDGKVVSVTGNTCKRGEDYAISECTNPVRTVTTTIKTTEGVCVPVKTSKPIPKGEMLTLMKLIANVNISLPIKIGDVIIKDVYGADVVATKTVLG